MFLPFYFLYYQEGLYWEMDQFLGGRSGQREQTMAVIDDLGQVNSKKVTLPFFTF